jgi:hypothetical protein
MTSGQYAVTCLLCGTEVGVVINERFLHHPACSKPLRQQDGRLCCCRCGGSLLLDQLDASELQADWVRSAGKLKRKRPASSA